MMKRRIISYSFLRLCMVLALFMFSTTAWASSGSGGACITGTGGSGSGGLDDTCNECISSMVFTDINSGTEIINAVFGAINTVLSKVEYSFFQGVVNGSGFQNAITLSVVLYVIMYGIILTFNLGSNNLSDATWRLTKVAILYMMTSPAAWSNFNTWVNTPIIGGMNQLIREFTVTAEGGSGTATVIDITQGSGSVLGSGSGGCLGYGTSGGSGNITGLDCNTFSQMFGAPMTALLSAKFFTAILSLITTGFFGWLIAFFLAWALFEFMYMMIGAILTYTKSIIGLAFMLGIAPIFFAFLLFEKTRNIFWGWLSQVLGLALQPVMLFAFLSFYVALINQAIPFLYTDPNQIPTDFCWTRWFGIPGTLWDIHWWRPTLSGGIQVNDWVCSGGNTCPEPINVINAIYFLLVCYLGKTFSQFIEKLANDITNGSFVNTPARWVGSPGRLMGRMGGRGRVK